MPDFVQRIHRRNSADPTNQRLRLDLISASQQILTLSTKLTEQTERNDSLQREVQILRESKETSDKQQSEQEQKESVESDKVSTHNGYESEETEKLASASESEDIEKGFEPKEEKLVEKEYPSVESSSQEKKPVQEKKKSWKEEAKDLDCRNKNTCHTDNISELLLQKVMKLERDNQELRASMERQEKRISNMMLRKSLILDGSCVTIPKRIDSEKQYVETIDQLTNRLQHETVEIEKSLQKAQQFGAVLHEKYGDASCDVKSPD